MIDRSTINKNLKIKSLRLENQQVVERFTTYDELINLIDLCKSYLVHVKNVKQNQKVALATFYWPEYLAWFYACSELGMSFIIVDYPKSEVLISKLAIYNDIDYVIYDDQLPPGFTNWKEKLIKHDEIYNHALHKVEPIEIKPSHILLYAATSGTTGTPKVVSYTHHWFEVLLHRNARLYNLKNTDRCFHSKGLHHGSVLCGYFLPTFFYCENHYHAPFHYLLDNTNNQESVLQEAWVNMIQKDKITRILVFLNQLDILTQYLKLENKQHDDLTVYVLSKVKQHDIDIVVNKFNYNMISVFGSTETAGPLFLPKITNEKDLSNMGELLDDFFKVSLREEKLIVELPSGEQIETGDKFEVINNQWIFKGRDNLFKIKSHTIYLNLLNETLESVTGLKREKDFDVIIDSMCDTIYLRSNLDIDINYLNKKIDVLIGSHLYHISKKIIAPRELFFSGIKFDPESIRLYCRNL
jgi:acyl-CoA synthetase (AMP-forming)/AMP-acid ligase II